MALASALAITSLQARVLSGQQGKDDVHTCSEIRMGESSGRWISILQLGADKAFRDSKVNSKVPLGGESSVQVKQKRTTTQEILKEREPPRPWDALVGDRGYEPNKPIVTVNTMPKKEEEIFCLNAELKN